MPFTKVHDQVLQIGNNLIDFYTGSLSVKEICEEVLDYFRVMNLIERDAFTSWIEAANWKKIQLSDSSKWLIKKGNDVERFIHIHPAKHSEHSIRVRATTLKTVLALQVYQINSTNQAKTDLENVNQIRSQLLELSPIKSLHSADSGIMRLWLLFQRTAPKNYP